MNLFNTDWKNYVGKGEKVSLKTQVSNKICLIFSLIYSIFSSFVLSVIFTVITIVEKLHIYKYFIGVALIIFIFGFIWEYFRFKSMRYIITNKGILEIKGVFVKSYKFVPFIKITDTRLHRNILDLIFGTGSIDVSTAGGTRITNGNSQPYEIRFLHIDDFMKVNEQVKKSIK